MCVCFTIHRFYECGYCSSNWTNKSKLLTHMHKHVNLEYKCPLCDRVYSRPDSLRTHIREKHTVEKKGMKEMKNMECQTDVSVWRNRDGDKLICSKCLKVFGKEKSYSYYNHVKMCTN